MQKKKNYFIFLLEPLLWVQYAAAPVNMNNTTNDSLEMPTRCLSIVLPMVPSAHDFHRE
jgi:hypothetical protein